MDEQAAGVRHSGYNYGTQVERDTESPLVERLRLDPFEGDVIVMEEEEAPHERSDGTRGAVQEEVGILDCKRKREPEGVEGEVVKYLAPGERTGFQRWVARKKQKTRIIGYRRAQELGLGGVGR